MRGISRIFFGCGLALWAGLLAAAESPAPQVLILNSYHPGYGWSDGELYGVLGVLSRGSPHFQPSIEYLDWRRFPNPAREALLLTSIEQKYAGRVFDLIITLDDPALQFAFKYRSRLGAATPIVFGGVNNYTPELLRGQRGVTGAAESADISGTLDFALHLHPNTREVAVIHDLNESALESRKALDAVIPRYQSRVRFRFITGWNMSRLLQAVSEQRPGSVVLLLSATIDADGHPCDVEYLRMLKERCQVPIYLPSHPMRLLGRESNWEHDFWPGLGGSMLSSELHGQAVGDFALRVLSGRSADSLPVLTSAPSVLAVDYEQMQRFNLPLSALPPGTKVFHRPVTFYETYRTRILATAAVIVFLSGTVLVLAINILRRRRAEVALRQSNERFQLIARATKDAVWDWRVDTDEMWWNESYREMMGVASAAPCNFATWSANVHAADREWVSRALQTAIAGKGETWVAEYRFRRSDGTDGYVLDRAYFLRDDQSKVVRVLGAMTDVTERKLAEQKLQRLATAVEQSTETILFLSLAGGIEYANPAFSHETGFTHAEAVGQSFSFLLDPASEPLQFAGIVAYIQEAGSWSGRLRCRRKDGASLTEQAVVSPLRDREGRCVSYILLGRDVTRELKLEEQVRFSQKMEAIGLLAGGVAHDFNNLLQVIQGNTQLALEVDTSETERHECLVQVRAASERAAQLTRQLLVFGRRQPLLTEEIDLNELVPEMLKMLRRLIGEHIHIDFTPGAQLGAIRANRGQLEQVLLNLCVNARDAMPQGGRLAIALDNVSFDADYCEAHVWARPGRFVHLSVTDTGCGMDPATVARVFDPFFSTKPKDKGTGLGLSVVYGIVQQHEGLIHIYSEPGVGTAFKIYLPVVAQQSSRKETPVAQAPMRGTGTILLVEDEAAVRQLGTRMLERLGYRVLTAADGREALEVFKQHADEISLLMLDAVMPHMGGRETYERIVAIRPGLPVLFCSGYSADVLQPGFALGPGMLMIQKPYAPDELARQIHILLRPAETQLPGSK
ncbi:MAG: PAS domain S-box protein [Opitutae bacterium]|nr:PAS domain S-box protein [Opitutae bacterium]